jgi:predicted  nucleic acid-binding Zn-ribbon protein
MKAGVFSLALLGLVDAASPVSKVVKLLSTMAEETEAALTEDKKIHDKYQCWCKKTIEETTDTIDNAKSTIETNEGVEQGSASSIASLSVGISDLKKELEEKRDTMATANADRLKSTKEFQETNQELTDAIGALKGAVTVLKKHQSFLQVGKKAPEVNTLTNALDRYASQHGEKITPSQRSAVENFLQGPSFDSYSSQSGQIFGILTTMLEQFEEDQSTATSNEEKAAKDHAALVKTLTENIKNLEKSLQKKMVQKAEAEGAKQEAASAIAEAKNAQAAAEELLAETQKSCQEEVTEYDTRTKEQTEELAAVSKAIEFLNSDEAHALFGATFSFVQTKMQKTAISARKAALVATISKLREAGVTGVSQLLLQTMKIPEGTFTVIIDKIDQLVVDIKEEMVNDVKERDAAIELMHKLETEIQALENEKANLTAKLDQLTADITKLTEELEALNTENAELEQSIKDAGANRSQENAAFQKEQANLSASVEILKKTVNVLASFYEKNSLLQQPAGFKTYEKNAGGNKVLAMINKIISDAEQEQALGINTENSQQTAYEKVVKEMNLTVDANNAEILDKTAVKADKEVKKNETEQALEDNTNNLVTKNGALSTAKADSDFLIKNFDLRQEHATNEIEALKEAKAFLQGMTA